MLILEASGSNWRLRSMRGIWMIKFISILYRWLFITTKKSAWVRRSGAKCNAGGLLKKIITFADIWRFATSFKINLVWQNVALALADISCCATRRAWVENLFLFLEGNFTLLFLPSHQFFFCIHLFWKEYFPILSDIFLLKH